LGQKPSPSGKKGGPVATCGGKKGGDVYLIAGNKTSKGWRSGHERGRKRRRRPHGRDNEKGEAIARALGEMRATRISYRWERGREGPMSMTNSYSINSGISTSSVLIERRESDRGARKKRGVE